MFLNHIFIICASLGKYNPNHKIIWVLWHCRHTFMSRKGCALDRTKKQGLDFARKRNPVLVLLLFARLVFMARKTLEQLRFLKHLLHGAVFILRELVIVNLQFVAEVTPEFLNGVTLVFHGLQQALHLFFVGSPLNRCRFSSVLMVLSNGTNNSVQISMDVMENSIRLYGKKTVM